MKILLLPDKKNWAFFSIAQSLVKYNPYPDIRLKIMNIKGGERDIKKRYKKFDRILVMGWQNYERVKFLDKSVTMVGIHSFHGWDERKTTPDKDAQPPSKLIKFLSQFLAVNVVSQRLANLFNKCGINVHYTPNGVDTQIFRRISSPPIGKTLIVGYSGSKAHDWRKGVSEFIIPAAKKAKVQAKIAMLSTDAYVPLEEMYKFYNKIDCYVCASSSEGMSLSVLEAAACGRPVITTRVSGCTEIIREGETGFFVDRHVKKIAKAINKMKDHNLLIGMSNAIVEDIRSNWCWSKRTKVWIDFMKS
ncbi:hypothetical protein LCGC14_1756380 [marine sediment metagenome]|uniref:Glycosyl transferase family 1 domain-containing protein n=1 Tax=marine sediment metagenome TaxID=412755 RepID=A0A0F9H2E1_9ZZZZ